jgi:uncharacterized membrane protein
MLDIVKNYTDQREIIAAPKTKEQKKRLRIVRDRPMKSVLKSITCRIVGTIDTILISYLLTGKVLIAFSIGSLEVFTKMFLYFLHERLWEQIRWGRMILRIHRTRLKAKQSFFSLF